MTSGERQQLRDRLTATIAKALSEGQSPYTRAGGLETGQTQILHGTFEIALVAEAVIKQLETEAEHGCNPCWWVCDNPVE